MIVNDVTSSAWIALPLAMLTPTTSAGKTDVGMAGVPLSSLAWSPVQLPVTMHMINVRIRSPGFADLSCHTVISKDSPLDWPRFTVA
ncbi:hypothetical protein F503_07766 [Ophiostoma piceae UAMH 11346]|uniref:Secreted protein n=1 Tax=Ophiostoma piceae (strain UAMH 11346) TaxID=1262450 RepID=S3D1H8_OPHP1|nr:hypothetical protein F503_07766 [Ophiostoma piceae UAMH 11346]